MWITETEKCCETQVNISYSDKVIDGEIGDENW